MALDVSSIQATVAHPLDAQKRAAAHVAQAAAGAVPADLNAAIRDLQRVSEAFNRRLSFSLNEKLGQVVVKVIDLDTDKVVREIPPKELQNVYERIREVIGLLYDAQA